MTFGFVAIADNGNLLASSDSANYELSGRYTNGVRTGTVTEYVITPVDYPIIFIEIPVGGKAALLTVSGSLVRVIGDGNYPINVYRRVQGAAGYGVAAFDATGAMTFKADAGLLNVRSIGTMGVGGSFSGQGTAISFPSLASYTTKYESTGEVYADRFVTNDTQWRYVCTTHWVYQCKQEWECGDKYDPFSGKYKYVCELVTRCAYVPEERCKWESYIITTITYVYAVVKTTNWAVYRSVARRVSETEYVQDWEVHVSGYYKDVVGWRSYDVTLNPLGYYLPPGYIPPTYFYDPTSDYYGYSGAFTALSTFPYSNGQSKSITASIMTR